MIKGLLLLLLGRKNAWRLGRSLYLSARQELHNEIPANGEATLVRLALAAHRAAGGTRPFVAFDIGANLGEWSAEVARVAGPETDWNVQLFEPVPSCFARVSERFSGEPRVRCNQMAVSNRDGTAEMIVVGETSGTNRLAADARPGDQTISVPLTRLEAHMAAAGIDQVDLVKIDAEGHDIEILRDIRALLDRGALGILQFEYNWRWMPNKGSLYEVFQLIEGTGYALARVYADGPAAFTSWNAELDRYFEANYALIRHDMVDAIGARTLCWDASNVAVPA